MKRLKEAQKETTPEWTVIELDVVPRQLKNNKSWNPMSFTYELFKPENAGKEMKVALLKMLNQIKKQQVFHKALAE